jgi:hypothetical protein
MQKRRQRRIFFKEKEVMKKRLWKITIVILILYPVCAQATEMRTYILGDIDGFVYNGLGSIDDVYVDPTWQNRAWYHWTQTQFDILEPDQIVLFSFTYNLAPNEQITAATLTLGLRKTIAGNTAGYFHANAGVGEWRESFYDLNWYPIGDAGITIRSVNLANGYNIISDMQGGLFNAAISGNVAIDYAQLTMEVIPEPMTFLLLSCGLWFARRSIK